MFRVLFLLFIIVPILEIYLLVSVGEVIGAGWVVMLVILTALAGSMLLRHQGIYTLYKARDAMQRGEIPAMAMLEGMVLLISGVLLLTPGFFTDSLGLLGLVPTVRQGLIRRFLAVAKVQTFGPGGASGPFGPGSGSGTGQGPRQDDGGASSSSGPRVIEGECKREDD